MLIKQFKLTNDDEIVCQVVWHEENKLIVTNAVRVLQFEDPRRGIRGYYFRPFMTFQDDVEVTINTKHILCELEPTEEMIKHYTDQIDDIKNVTRTSRDDGEDFSKALKDFMKDVMEDDGGVPDLMKKNLH